MSASRLSISQAAFAARVDSYTEAALRTGVRDFAALLNQLPGVYPTELLASLDRLLARKIIEEAAASMMHRQASANDANDANDVAVVEGRSLLPLPHPLDYEWRFTPDTARCLLNLAAILTPPASDLLLFGTPGLAVEALTLPIGRRTSFIVENNSVTDRLFALNSATGTPLTIALCSAGLPHESADAVLLDPPWYPDFTRPMLAAAAYACRPGGFVLISLPPDGTRPSAEADRRSATAFARRLKLALIEHSPLSLRYETPFFERNALRAVGIHPPKQWRRGDLMVFRKEQTATNMPPISASHRREWTEATVGRMRLFIRRCSTGRSRDANLKSLVKGDILPTVSRRDRRRRLADVWTSGNRIFQTNNPQLVLEAAASCADDIKAPQFQPGLLGLPNEREALERVAEDLQVLAALEAEEERRGFAAPRRWGAAWNSSSISYERTSVATTSG